MAKIKLTKKLIEAIEPEAKDIIVWDSETRGLGLRVTAAGVKTFVLYYRTRAGEQRKPRLGRFGEMTVEAARSKATDWLGAVERGEDPSQELQEKRETLTYSEFLEIYYRDHSSRKKSYSQKIERYAIDKHLAPVFGKRRLTSITANDVAKWMAKLSAVAPVAANRTYEILRCQFNKAEEWGYHPGPNPCKRIKKNREKPRKRYLSPEELLNLGKALAEAEETKQVAPWAIAAIRLLLLTGCRRNEVLGLRWEDIDFARNVIHLTDSKVGPREVILNEAAVRVLSTIKRDPSGMVFPSPMTNSPMIWLQGSWKAICKLAKLTDLHVHDLRHSHASIAIALGQGLPVIAGLLGHAKITTTQRYSHLQDNLLQAASNQIGNHIEAMMQPGGAEVVEMTPAPAANRKKAVAIGA